MAQRRAYTLRDQGDELTVEVWVERGRNHARLLVNGQEAAAADTDVIGDVTLEQQPNEHWSRSPSRSVPRSAARLLRKVRVSWLWRGRVGRCALVEESAKGGPGWRRKHVTPFEPPPGTRAARMYRFQRDHPRLFAARHVLVETGAVLFAIFGVGALVSAFLRSVLPRIDWSWLPSISLPDIDPPSWLRYLDPLYWLRRLLPDWDLPGWLPDVSLPRAEWLKYAVPIIISALVAIEEVRRRRKRQQREDDLRRERTAVQSAKDSAAPDVGA
jgi:hypothetical protein